MSHIPAAQTIANAIGEALRGQDLPVDGFDEMDGRYYVDDVTPLPQAGYLTNDPGVVLHLPDGRDLIVSVQLRHG